MQYIMSFKTENKNAKTVKPIYVYTGLMLKFQFAKLMESTNLSTYLMSLTFNGRIMFKHYPLEFVTKALNSLEDF